MVLSKGKEFSILVKIDRKFPDVDTNKNVIAMEIHEVSKKLPPDQTKVKMPITKQRSKRAKILSDDEKMKEIVAGIPHVEKDIAAVEIDIENPQKKKQIHARGLTTLSKSLQMIIHKKKGYMR